MRSKDATLDDLLEYDIVKLIQVAPTCQCVPHPGFNFAYRDVFYVEWGWREIAMMPKDECPRIWALHFARGKVAMSWIASYHFLQSISLEL